MSTDEDAPVATLGEFDAGVSWMAYPEESMRRTSHALIEDDGVWLVDPVDPEDPSGLDEWLAERGEVVGVTVLLDRHKRDAAAIARRHDVAVHLPRTLAEIEGDVDAPTETYRDELGDTGYVPRAVVDRSFWREVALHRPDDETLVVPEAVGTAGLFRAGDERLGVHPMLRFRPPRRSLGRLDPDRVLVGHGPPVLEDAAAALRDGLAGARRRIPRAYAGALRAVLTG